MAPDRMGRKPSLFRGALVGGALAGGTTLAARLALAEMEMPALMREMEEFQTSAPPGQIVQETKRRIDAHGVGDPLAAAAVGAVLGVAVQGLRRLDHAPQASPRTSRKR